MTYLLGHEKPSLSELAHSVKHDLIFFEKRSTPKVVSQGKSFTAPESYGKQTKRRAATPEEEKQIARGDWVRVDEHGIKGGQPGYKKTRMAGREHLVQQDSIDDILAHHGVKGMKWGVRKDQKLSGQVKGNTADQNALIAIGAAFVALHLGYKIANTLDSGKKYAKQNANVAWKVNQELTGKKSIEDLHSQVVKPINKDYPAKGTKMNCRRCTFSYELRRRGLDVEATKSKMASGQDEKGLHRVTLNAFKGKNESIWGKNQIASPRQFYSTNAIGRSKLIFDSLSKEPEGSRGELAVGWNIGGGHSMAYEVINKKPVIFDNQNAVVYQDATSFAKFGAIVNDAAYTRLDNLPLSDPYLKRWAVNVK